MEHTSLLERMVRGVLIVLIVLFFLFPIFWIFLMSFQTNEDILRIPPSLFFTPTLSNYSALITGKLVSTAGTLDIAFMKNLWNSVLLSTVSVVIALILGVPAAYAFARFKFRLGEDIAFTLLSFRFAPPLLVLLPLSLYFQELGLTDTYIGLHLGISADRAAAHPLDRARLFRGSVPGRVAIRLSRRRSFMVAHVHAHRNSIGGSGDRRRWAPGFHFLLEQLRLCAHFGVGRQTAGHGRRTRLRDRLRHSIWTDRCGNRAVRDPDARACALCATLSRRGSRLAR